MHRQGWVVLCVLLVLLACGLASPMAAQSFNSRQQVFPNSASYWDDPLNWKQQFVPDSRLFWDNSENWTTNYGPAYRDTVELPTQMLACSTQFALCFHSGPYPYPCTLSPDGQSANCVCTVATTTNYTLLTAILNRSIYNATVAACGREGLRCPNVGDAPVCGYLNGGALDPGCERDLHLRSQLAAADLEGAVASESAGHPLPESAIRRLHDRAVHAERRRFHRHLQVSGVQWQVPTRPQRTTVFPRR